MSRAQYQIQLRVVKPGTTGFARVASREIRGLADDAWKAGWLLTQTTTGRAKSLPGPINASASGPVRFIALSDYKGDGGYVSVQGIGPDTILEAQMKAGKATASDVGKRGILVQDTTTGRYAVELTSSGHSLEIVNVEPNYQPGGPNRNKNYNLVWFRFLPEVFAIAPPTPGS